MLSKDILHDQAQLFHSFLNIIQGSKFFVELQTGIFNLMDPKCIETI